MSRKVGFNSRNVGLAVNIHAILKMFPAARRSPPRGSPQQRRGPHEQRRQRGGRERRSAGPVDGRGQPRGLQAVLPPGGAPPPRGGRRGRRDQAQPLVKAQVSYVTVTIHQSIPRFKQNFGAFIVISTSWI